MKHPSLVVFLAAFAAIGCGHKPRVVLPAPTPARLGAVERGSASWYGLPYHGRRTSNGEVYDMDGLTAAHLSLPFDTVVRVRNLSNDRSVDVRINDRGPFVRQRLIDLSREAARRIDMIGPGTTLVEVTVIATPAMTRAQPSPPATVTVAETRDELPAPPVPVSGSGDVGARVPECFLVRGHSVQVGSFSERSNAEDLAARVAGSSPVAIQSAAVSGRPVYRVLVGAELGLTEAQALQSDLARKGADGFVTQLDGPFCQLY